MPFFPGSSRNVSHATGHAKTLLEPKLSRITARIQLHIEHSGRNSISTSNSFCFLYDHTNNDVVDHFPKMSKILQSLSEGQMDVSEYFPKWLKITEDFRRCPKIAGDFREKSEDVSIIHQHDIKLTSSI